ncbi:hypothetical protein [Ralstonia solanacearum]|nr:hypothetical protein [Ralstonia solanacearum]
MRPSHAFFQETGAALFVRRTIPRCGKATTRKALHGCDKSMIRLEKPAAG